MVLCIRLLCLYYPFAVRLFLECCYGNLYEYCGVKISLLSILDCFENPPVFLRALSSLQPDELITLVLNMSLFLYLFVNENSSGFLTNVWTYRLFADSYLFQHVVFCIGGYLINSLAIQFSYLILNSRFVVFSKYLWSSKTFLS